MFAGIDFLAAVHFGESNHGCTPASSKTTSHLVAKSIKSRLRDEMQSERRKFKRTPTACIACRQSKIKCSGDDPCTSCQRRFMKCRFADTGNTVVVSQRYLESLHKKIAENASPPGSKKPEDTPSVSEETATASQPAPSPPSPVIDHARNIWTSPFTLPSTIIKSGYRDRLDWIWLAPSSLWSFTARLTVMMTEKLHLNSPSSAPNPFDRDVYPLQWKYSSVDTPPDITGLPSMDYALYLFNTVKFHLIDDYQFINEESFIKDLREFYKGDPLKKANESRLWFIQFLLVLAFGHAFLGKSKNPTEAPGSNYFMRAMSLMPEHPRLWKDTLLVIEVLALIGLYLYSIDHRESAHIYLGQAMRIAQLEGLHTQLPEDELGPETMKRCRNLWWTLYILDRHFSSSLGLPMITHESDITTVLIPPNTPAQEVTTLSLQVKLYQLLTHIITTIYRTEKTQLGPFLELTRSILHTMAGYAQDIEVIINPTTQNSLSTVPKGTRHVTLLYHKCVIFATRPLLLSVLKERLENLGQEGEDWQSFIHLTKPLISIGIKSAVKTLEILSEEEGLHEVFLPFDLEFTYGAILHLTIAYTLFPHLADGPDYSKIAHSILDDMIRKGNKVAEVRKDELSHLETLSKELVLRGEQQGLQTLTLLTPETLLDPKATPSEEQQAWARGVNPDMITQPIIENPQLASAAIPNAQGNVELLDSLGISSEEFFTIMDQIDTHEMSYNMMDDMESWQGDA